MAAKTMTLPQALQHAATAVYMDLQNAPALFDLAVEYHTRKGLKADLAKGTTRDRDGWRSAFTAYDWAHLYEGAPHFAYFDFFRPALLNAVSRLQRGLPVDGREE